ncbi:eukaryotic translation initiation factor 5B-like isoform X4 [Polyodon spathula]|uniref:eukaryotic translation initiation factor 5B-like isoform X3 n=1 Tax=Polyodon spathula TaxID=7913 RepID=UPI001B7F55A3|nr:eukaryotic translation initiation factor 5B-like isoform X3 [Polyodon spathula]XP_041127804.1 eukaryotic translation initiation factor 5B-like isoform X4 [Polyodon spathula]
MGKKQKNKSEDSAKDDVDIDALAAEIEGTGTAKEQDSSKSKGKKKKNKKNQDFDEDAILKELEELNLESQSANQVTGKIHENKDEAEPVPIRAEKRKTRKGKKASFEEDEEDEQGDDAMENGKKNKKTAKQPPVAAAASASTATEDPSEEEDDCKATKKGKGGKKAARKPLSEEDEEEDHSAKGGARGGTGGGIGGDCLVDSGEESDDFSQRGKAQQKKQKAQAGGGAAVKADSGGEEDDGSFKMKTAAQKKAEKKERDRKKKEEEKSKQKKQKEKEKGKEKEVGVEAPNKAETEGAARAEPKKLETTASEDKEGGEDAAAGGADDNDGDKKKKDKKKKKGEKEEKVKKKGPSKATVIAMQEALARMKEEEEQAKQEEEEHLRRLEELEAQRLEQERLEQERKEKKKQKEKERKERLKKEGKLLTKTQKEARARAEATLKLLQAQGVEVPSKDSVPKKKPVYGDKKKKKPQQQIQEEQMEVTSPTAETISIETTAEVKQTEEVKEQKPDADLDDWEAMASDEEKEKQKEMKKVHIEVKEKAGEHNEDEESDEEADDEEEEDDEEESEEEEEEEEEEEKASDDTSQQQQQQQQHPPAGKSLPNKRPSKDLSSESETESDSDDGRTKEERLYDKAKKRIEKRRAENIKNINTEKLRSPVICVLGHVDTGKTKILDKLRHTNVQDGEAGGITQQIGATNVPLETIIDQIKMVKNFDAENIKIPGMLIIDTPGHESFSNLRNRGSSLCDIAILVVDIMHGLEPQTLESINLLKEKKCPFIVALNKIDRLYDWKKSPETDLVTTLKKQKKNTKDEFDERAKAVILEFAQQGLNAALFHENKDPRTFVSLVPTSAHTGDGMGNLIALLVELTQTMLSKRLAHCDELRAQVMEVKALPGMGTTIDVILINGSLREGETIIVPGVEGPIVTQIRGLLLPPPLKELRVKNQYEKHKEVCTAQGVKILGKDLEKTLAGLPLLVAYKEDEIPVLRDELIRELKQTLNSIKLEEKGVYVQASTLGSLEALLEFLRTSKVPYAGINIGPVHKKDVMKASAMLEHDLQYAVILAFDVKIERDSQELADSLGVRIFSAEIIYHLFDAFTKYREDYKKQKQDEFKHIAVFPCKIRILPQFIFNSRDPIVMGVNIEAGVLRQGTLLCVPSKGFVEIGIVTSIEINHKTVDSAKKGQEICIKVDPIPGESPKMFGRHFEATDIIVSKITRQSIDALKDWFRDEMTKSDWQLIMELKKTFEII